jgi:hypothetical protein
MSAASSLHVYITDHMVGSVAASDLARRGADNSQGAAQPILHGSVA